VFTADEKTAKFAVPNTGGTRAKDAASTRRTGFLQASTAVSSVIAASYTNVGHVFGRLGQGAATTPGATGVKAPFQWFTPDNKHTMLVSILPVDHTSTQMVASTDEIDFVFTAAAFENNANIKPPTRPIAAIPPNPVSAIYIQGASAALACFMFSTLN